MYSREQAEDVLVKGLPLLEQDWNRYERERLKHEIRMARESGDSEKATELTRLRDELAKT